MDTPTSEDNDNKKLLAAESAGNPPLTPNNDWHEGTEFKPSDTLPPIEATPSDDELIESTLKFNPPAVPNDKPIIVLPAPGQPIIETSPRLYRAIDKKKIMFVQDRRVVEVLKQGEGGLTIEPVSVSAFRSRIEEVAVLYRVGVDNKGKRILRPCRCSEDMSKALLAARDAGDLLSPLSMVSTSGVLAVGLDGKAYILGPGYHRLLGGIYIGDHGLIPELSLEEGKRGIAELMGGFRYLTEADFIRAVAAFLAAIAVPGGLFGRDRVPLFYYEADEPQTGKGFMTKLLAAAIGQELSPVTPRRGGVGSFDEAFDAALQCGLSLVLIDNLRGALDSPHLESFLTWDTAFRTRTPHKRWVHVNPLRYLVLATSNGLKTTLDLRRRMVRIRLRKQPEGHHYKKYREGDIYAHVQANHLYFLGCGMALLRPWIDAGCARTGETRHDLRGAVGALDWILRNAFSELPRLMDGAEWEDDSDLHDGGASGEML